MTNKHHQQQRGITMIELLLTVTISAIILSITASVLLSAVETNSRVQQHLDLRQEANLIITQLRNDHQEGKYFTCYEDYLGSNALHFEEINLTQDSEIYCDLNQSIDPKKDLHVTFTIADSFNQQFEVDTTIEAEERTNESDIELPPPEESEDGFYDYLKLEDVFIYGSDIGISGSTLVDGKESGNIIIHNGNQSDLVFKGDNDLDTEQIIIDKRGQRVRLESSTNMGDPEKTNVVSIIGDVELNNGGAEIRGKAVYIDGNVDFNNSAKIKAETVVISGNVTFENWSALLEADDIFIGGTIEKRQQNNIKGSLGSFEQQMLPNQPAVLPPPLREKSWFHDNGYSVIESYETVRLQDGVKIFGDSITVDTWHNDTDNVVMVSKGDIHINNFGGSTLRGVLLAPHGEVTFDGDRFEGLVITKDGFQTFGNPDLVFVNIEHFFPTEQEFPFVQEE